MHFSDILFALRNSTPTGRRSPIVFRHRDIELELLSKKVRDRPIPWDIAWSAVDDSMPYDMPRPRSSAESISVDKLFHLAAKCAMESQRNAVLERLVGKLAGLQVAPWDILNHIADEHIVEKERNEE
jgi:hypothetical protein